MSEGPGVKHGNSLKDRAVSKRRAKSTRRRKRWFPRGLAAIALIVGVAAGLLSWWLSPTYGCVAINSDSEALLLNVDPLARGTAQKYCWALPDPSETVRFIVARQSNGAINVVLDACRVCYLNNLGYRRTKGGLVCRFCGNRYSIDSLSIGKMSCLPFNLPFQVDHGWVKIKTSDLKAKADFFPAQPVAEAPLRATFQWLTGLIGGNEMRMADGAQGPN
jgi:uncharacterized membrane protein